MLAIAVRDAAGRMAEAAVRDVILYSVLEALGYSSMEINR